MKNMDFQFMPLYFILRETKKIMSILEIGLENRFKKFMKLGKTIP